MTSKNKSSRWEQLTRLTQVQNLQHFRRLTKLRRSSLRAASGLDRMDLRGVSQMFAAASAAAVQAQWPRWIWPLQKKHAELLRRAKDRKLREFVLKLENEEAEVRDETEMVEFRCSLFKGSTKGSVVEQPGIVTITEGSPINKKTTIRLCRSSQTRPGAFTRRCCQWTPSVKPTRAPTW